MKFLPLILSLILAATSVAQTTQPAINVTISPAQANGDSWPLIQPQLTKAASAPGSIINLMGGGAHTTYNLSQSLQITNATNVTVNLNGATIKFLAGQPLQPWGGNCLFWVQGSSDIVIENGTLDGNAKARGGYNVAAQNIGLYWSNDVTISGITSKGSCCDDALAWGGAGNPNGSCRNLRITKCNLTGALRNAISLVNAAYVRIDHNQFHDLTKTVLGAGVDIESNFGDPSGSNHDILIDSNSFSNCYHGVFAQNIAAPYNIVITGNTSAGGVYPFETEFPSTVIAWNEMTGAGGYAIIAPPGATVNSNTINQCPAGLAIDPAMVALNVVNP